MSVAQWNNFTDYIVGDQVQNGSSLIYGCILANKNQTPPNVTYWNPLTPSGGGNIVSLNGLTNADIDLISSQITFTPNAGAGTLDLAVSYPATGVTEIVANATILSGSVGIISTDSSIIVTAVGNDVDLSVPLPIGFDLEGLQNKIGIFPVKPVTTSTALAALNAPPSVIVPDATAPTSSTTPDNVPCWLYTKPAGNAGFNWHPYNPRFSDPVAPLPYTKAGTGTRLKTLWALIQPTVNIYTAGLIALNAYSYDDLNPPTSGFYNTRWAYSNTAGINSGQSGVNLFANFTYLVYAFDAPRTTNQTGVGQPDNQDWGMRDPYDIYTDVHHIPLQNCVIAFNPWTDGTNYRSWAGTSTFTAGQQCVYSGFGGTPNGIFYTAVQNSIGQVPVSATGVPNTAYWIANSPQPTQYAQQTVLSLNINGINGTATGWTAGPLLRVLSMGYSVGTDPLTTTESYEIVLQ